MTSAAGRSLVRGAWEGLLDVVFPPRCVACRTWGAFLCEGCEGELRSADGHRCEICWQPGGSPCQRCFDARPAFEAARSVYDFEGPARDLAHALKYQGVAAVGGVMAKAMVARLEEWGIEADAVVPVPMATSRQRRRGYNQAERLAREIGEATVLRVETKAIRRIPGPSQVELGSREARLENALTAYEPGRRTISGNVLIVDDVMTTGATLDACARVLKGAGAERVWGLTFARES